jgi:hypothetical protein
MCRICENVIFLFVLLHKYTFRRKSPLLRGDLEGFKSTFVILSEVEVAKNPPKSPFDKGDF